MQAAALASSMVFLDLIDDAECSFLVLRQALADLRQGLGEIPM